MTIEEMLTILSKTPPKMLAQWWCKLNKWEWVSQFRPPEKERDSYLRWRSIIMDEIENHIGYRECLREWNKDNMGKKQFDEWYIRNRRRI